MHLFQSSPTSQCLGGRAEDNKKRFPRSGLSLVWAAPPTPAHAVIWHQVPPRISPPQLYPHAGRLQEGGTDGRRGEAPSQAPPAVTLESIEPASLLLQKDWEQASLAPAVPSPGPALPSAFVFQNIIAKDQGSSADKRHLKVTYIQASSLPGQLRFGGCPRGAGEAVLW